MQSFGPHTSERSADCVARIETEPPPGAPTQEMNATVITRAGRTVLATHIFGNAPRPTTTSDIMGSVVQSSASSVELSEAKPIFPWGSGVAKPPPRKEGSSGYRLDL